MSVCLSVCLSQIGVLSKWLNRSRWLLAKRLLIDLSCIVLQTNSCISRNSGSSNSTTLNVVDVSAFCHHIIIIIIIIIRSHCLHAVRRCELLLRMLQIAWSVFVFVCLSVFVGSHVCAVQKRLICSRCRLRNDSCRSKESCVRCDPDIPTGRGKIDMGEKSVMRPFA